MPALKLLTKIIKLYKYIQLIYLDDYIIKKTNNIYIE